MTPEEKPKTAPTPAVKKQSASPYERAKREQEWSDREHSSSAPERESYRDGSSINECWNRRQY